MRFTYVGIHWLLSTALVASLMVATSCDSIAPLFEGEKTVTAPHLDGAPLRVETANGSIKITKSDRRDVEVIAKISAISAERLAATKIVTTRFGDKTLMVRCDWPHGKPESREACSFEVHIPDAVGVNLETENGNVQVFDLAGPADLISTNGNIQIERQAGPIKAVTTNGTVAVSEAACAVKAETSNGAIKIALAPESAGPVEATGVNAMIDLAVGPSFAGSLWLRAMNGMVQVDPTIKAHVLNPDPHEMQLAFGDANAQSSATTVNGMVHVHAIGNPSNSLQ